MKFVIDGKPIPQSRPRFRNARKRAIVYDPSAADKDEARMAVLQQMREQGVTTKLHGPLKIRFTFYCGGDRSKHMEGPYHYKRPDIDNYIKFYLDVLNELAYSDDSQIVELNAVKLRSYGGKTEIEVEEVDVGLE